MRYLSEHEQLVRGTSEFPVAFYHVTKEHIRYEMPFHWHMECELIVISKGCFRLSVGNAALLLSAGDAAFVPSGMIHGGTPKDCEYQCVVFDYDKLFQEKRVCRELYRKWQFLIVQQFSHFSAQSPEASLAAKLCEILSAPKQGYEFKVIGMLWELLGWLIEKARNFHPENAADHRRRELLKRVLWRIRVDYDKDLTLDDLARESGLAPRYFCRIFREATGRTPIDYLNFYRVECAAELLCGTDNEILDIAFSCGFHDAAYFSRVFRQYKQMSPREYRQRHHREADIRNSENP
ncbi:MAG: AraC family transcriptional regulator [Lachnospiraceae bacterium]|nr:AraC family transcriptional regulator [Lachnospiraceae bacterium]